MCVSVIHQNSPDGAVREGLKDAPVHPLAIVASHQLRIDPLIVPRRVDHPHALLLRRGGPLLARSIAVIFGRVECRQLYVYVIEGGVQVNVVEVKVGQPNGLEQLGRSWG